MYTIPTLAQVSTYKLPRRQRLAAPLEHLFLMLAYKTHLLQFYNKCVSVEIEAEIIKENIGPKGNTLKTRKS